MIILSFILAGCGGGGGGADNAINEMFTISYNANGAESGVVPASQGGDEDSPQNIQANTGNLSKSGYLFDGWNSAADGSGTNYLPGTSYKGKSVTLYAKWAAIFNYQIVNAASPSSSLNGIQRAPGSSYLKITGLTEKGRALSSISIPEVIDGYTVATIGENAFLNCNSIASIALPETVTTIEQSAFKGCVGIATMIIPRSVSVIGDSVFEGCSGLTSLMLLSTTPPTMGTGALEGCSAIVSVPVDGLDDYKAAGGWSTYSSNIAGYSTETFTVRFDGQSATTQASPTSKLVEPPAVTVGTLPTSPARTGYIFGGWFTPSRITFK